MVDRIILGAKAAGDPTFGIWISVPGVDVNVAGKLDLMLSSERQSVQIVQTGSFTFNPMRSTQTPVTVAIASLGFYPVVLITGDLRAGFSAGFLSGGPYVTWDSLTQFRLRVHANASFNYPNTGGWTFTYQVLNVPQTFSP